MPRNKTKLRWDQKNGLKGVTVYLTATEKRHFAKLAEADDKSLALYHRRLIQKHLSEHKLPED